MLLNFYGMPAWLEFGFLIIAAITVNMAYRASGSRSFLIILIAWSIVLSVASFLEFFIFPAEHPERIPMVIGPGLATNIILLLTPRGRRWLRSWNLRITTYMHTIRIGVELVLYALYGLGMVSILMTLEGTNWDILSGITAPVVAYIAFKDGKLRPDKKKVFLIWNVVCLILLLNVVITAILSVPTPFQQFAFDQPNIGVFYFPFTLLPGVVVPLMLMGHLAALVNLKE